MKPASAADDSSLRRLGSLIQSATDTSYEILEDDDYEPADPSRRSNSLRQTTVPRPSARSLHSASPDPPLRSPSTDHPVPLSHPTPDLQSFQGAYVGNVERLERSAECLSSSLADIGSEIRKMDLDQKKCSPSSASDSVAQGSIHAASRSRSASGSQLAQVPEPGHGLGYGEFPDRVPDVPMLPPIQLPANTQYGFSDQDQNDMMGAEGGMERPLSAGSNDTFQQARTLFTDFDGVHFVSHDNGTELTRNVSLTKPPLATASESYKEPQTGENMVYYPAPVPMMLNLPPRLSHKPAAERENRRTQLLGSIPLENRKSAPWLSEQDEEGVNDERGKATTDMPPHLRASVFFEQQASPVDVQVKQASAVATLESILDASARAPVTAFTDHPFAGHLGSEVYGRSRNKASKGVTEQKKKNKSRNTLVSNRHTLHPGPGENSATVNALPKQTESGAADVHESTALRTDSDRDQAHSESTSGEDHSGSSDDDEQEGSDEELAYVGQPNTLLAELQMRKQELKQRQRTAANSVGLHTTLLELDAVAQKQSEHRRQKRVTLAWEGPDMDKAEDETEDVPLAMLYPDKANLPDESRPLGLMEKRELEESEPLSRRRARLRGEAPPGPQPALKTRPSTMTFRPVDGPVEPDSGDEGETLGQRLQRLKAKDQNSVAAQSDFATEVLAELGHLNEDDRTDKMENKIPPENETLAQRRARLQGEAKMQQKSQLRPVGYDPALHRNSMDPRLYGNRMAMHQAPSQFANVPSAGFPQHPGHAMANPYGHTTGHPNTFYSDAILGMNNLAYAMSGNYYQPPKPVIDPGQREIIDRWRQSIK